MALCTSPPGRQPFPRLGDDSLAVSSAYNLPSVEALVRYLHAAAGFPVKSTWLTAITDRNYDTWPGLTLKNANKYFPESKETLKGHIVQSRKYT